MHLRFLTLALGVCGSLFGAGPVVAEEDTAARVRTLLALHHIAGADAAAVVDGLPTAALAQVLSDALPFTYWYDGPALKRFTRARTAARRLGIRIVQAPAGLLVVPLVDLPGLPAVRRLVGVDGMPVTDLDAVVMPLATGPDTLELTVAPLEEPDGSVTTVTLRRLAGTGSVEAENGVTAQLVGGRFVVTIAEFVAGRTGPALDVAIAEAAGAIERVVLDLRWSSGGDVLAAMDVAELFLPVDTVLARLAPALRDRTAWRTGRSGPLAEVPLVVLVSPWTASAAEILAQTFKSIGRAVVIGRPTRGKCVVQQLFAVDEGRLLVPVTELLPPTNGAGCHGRGVVPHVEVPFEILADDLALVERASLHTASVLTYLCWPFDYPDATAARAEAAALAAAEVAVDVVLLGADDGAQRVCMGPARRLATLEDLARRMPRTSWWREPLTWTPPTDSRRP